MAIPVKFGISTWIWTSPFQTADIRALFEKTAAMGFEAIEIAIEDPALIDPIAVQSAMQEFNLQVITCGAFGPSRDLTNEDTAVHDNCFRYIENCFDFCLAWNAGFLAGPMYSAVGKARMVPPEQRKQEWQLAVKNLRTVCGMAASKNLQIALEPLNRFESDLVNTAADVVQLVNDINHPAAKIMLDGFHMNIEEPDMESAIITAGKHLVHFQISENYRGIPGTGQTNWKAIRNGLETIGYSGVVSIESFTPKNQELAGAVCIWRPFAESQDTFARAGLAFLQQWAG
ncbi:sugar phosphate isomerase/epimerase family protein [Flavihumibacter fluvii]|uniref:sugar phosphate isomerase/epimerase family protein n=1 Tax=Flavihumibacter fluvii TaxID=2838157 RepID=UPI001BDE4C3B|nr:sugar phosphate isomerase/epimerase family protein [Flavihumibacter fluvii]ULQ53267.1 sugar phosphate isomerase/epimerase [Flavihumibacter fluvii]